MLFQHGRDEQLLLIHQFSLSSLQRDVFSPLASAVFAFSFFISLHECWELYRHESFLSLPQCLECVGYKINGFYFHHLVLKDIPLQFCFPALKVQGTFFLWHSPTGHVFRLLHSRKDPPFYMKESFPFTRIYHFPGFIVYHLYGGACDGHSLRAFFYNLHPNGSTGPIHIM